MRIKFLLLTAANILLFVYSCKKETKLTNEAAQEVHQDSNHSQIAPAMRKFSEIFSKAIDENADLRKFVRQEALKEFDNDYDVFYPFVKDDIVSDGKSFRQILMKYTSDERELEEIESALPLLTIYVPELPSGFNAENWDDINEKPYVSPTIVRNKFISLYKEGIIKDSLEIAAVPGFPVLVVKNNERLRLKNNQQAQHLLSKAPTSARNPNVFPTKDSYEFIDEAFDAKVKKLSSQRDVAPLIIKANGDLIPEVVSAFNVMGINNQYWQRDHIYYGLTTDQNSKGPLNRRVIERIESIKFTSDAFFVMSDQEGDPVFYDRNVLAGHNPDWDVVQNLFWQDGRFEIHIDILINNLSGLGTTLQKFFSVSHRELFDVVYERKKMVSNIYEYRAIGLSPKDYYPRINLISWNLEQNGFAWKFIVSEKDEETVETRTETVTSEFATNFGINNNITEKIGINFGGSAKKTIVNTHTFAITRNSDQLGTLELDFSKPVVTSNDGTSYSLYSISNPYVEMTVLPVYDY
ncbi:hypothetical protein RYH73_16710 [Olivibacter sp. CPCC 100613]|uniref:hypothetical protein n=1 Tax=Olivibacter sp. CPCC 100613 TaxID=3079931 RepID=UPI002FF60ED6